jgi:hypothetical protein
MATKLKVVDRRPRSSAAIAAFRGWAAAALGGQHHSGESPT